MKERSVMHIRWWSAPLAVLLSVTCFTVLEKFEFFLGVSATLRSVFLSVLSVILFFGINLIDKRKGD